MTSNTPSTSTDLKDPVTESDHVVGPDGAPVTLVQYGDYQCEESRKAYPVLQGLQERFGDELRIVFRHFPRRDKHPDAEQAALLAEAAGEQGRFWEAHDRLYTHPGGVNQAAIAGIGETIGLTDIPGAAPTETRAEGGHRYYRRIHDQVEGARRSGVTSTPTIFINGRRHHGSYDEQTLQAAIEAAR